MFPQTYGTRYYGKRFPIKTEKQITAFAVAQSFITGGKTFMRYLSSACGVGAKIIKQTALASMLATCKTGSRVVNKTVNKKILFCVAGVARFRKDVFSKLIAVCGNGANITKNAYKGLFPFAVGMVTLPYRTISKGLTVTTKGMAAIRKTITHKLFATCNNVARITKGYFVSLFASTMGRVVKKLPFHHSGTIYGGAAYGSVYGAATVFEALEGIKRRVILAPKKVLAVGKARFLPKSISKIVYAKTKGTVRLVKHITLTPIFVACESGAKIVRHVILAPIVVVSRGVATMKRYIRKTLSAIAVGLVSIQKHRLFEFEFIGPFAPGDIVKINSKTMEVTLNDENILHLIKKADFPIIPKGQQKLIYKDREGNRIVKVTVKWRDRWL